jgi:hypothetical protein
MTLTIEIFNSEGDVLGVEEVYYEEVGYKGGKTLLELNEVEKAHMDDVRAHLDLVYGYFKYEIL